MGSLRSRWNSSLQPRARKLGEVPADTASLSKGRIGLPEIMQVLEMYRQGFPARVISRKMGRSPKQIHNVVERFNLAQRPAETVRDSIQRVDDLLCDLRSRLHSRSESSGPVKRLPARAYTLAEEQYIKDLVQDCCPRQYVARCLDRSPASIGTKIKTLGLRCKSCSHEEREMVLTYREQGLEPLEIAAKIGRSEHFVRGTLRLKPPEQVAQPVDHS